METTLKQRIAIAILLIVGGMGIGTTLSKTTNASLTKPTIEAVTPVVLQLSSVEQHIAEVLQTAYHEQPEISSLLPWVRRLTAGEGILLLPLDRPSGDVFAICPSGVITLDAACTGYALVHRESQLGALLRSDIALTLVLNPETNEIYVHDRVGYSILPREQRQTQALPR